MKQQSETANFQTAVLIEVTPLCLWKQLCKSSETFSRTMHGRQIAAAKMHSLQGNILPGIATRFDVLTLSWLTTDEASCSMETVRAADKSCC